MNADRELVIAEAMQQALTQLKGHTWNDVESVSSVPDFPLETLFLKASQDLDHVTILNSMLTTAKPIKVEKSDPKKCEDSVEFRRISSFFQSNTDRFLRSITTHTHDIYSLVEELRLLNPFVELDDTGFLPHISITISNIFTVKLIFSIEKQLSFVVVHSISEKNRSPFEQSDFRIFRTLAVYFSRVIPDFTLKYGKRGIVEFSIWLKSYDNLIQTSCSKCGGFIERDLTGDLLPPIIRTVSNCSAYHIRCAPFEIELPDFGYVTLMSEEQMQEKLAKASK